jgi:hypothetical protein
MVMITDEVHRYTECLLITPLDEEEKNITVE